MTTGQLKIEQWPIDKVLPYARNARLHSDEQVQQIANSMDEFGFVNPILVDARGEIVAGHGRALAASLLGLPKVPVIVLGHLNPAQVKALRIADNQLTLNAAWDVGLLKGEIADLKAGDYNLDLLGFPELQLVEFMSGLGTGAGNRQSGMGSLAEKFGVPPFSVLNAREGWWQDRKRAWIALGLQAELGRGESANDRSKSGAARINDAADMQRAGSPDQVAAIEGQSRLAALRAKPRRKPDAIPGGAGRNAAWRHKGLSDGTSKA